MVLLHVLESTGIFYLCHISLFYFLSIHTGIRR